jgi:hypothetical protein
MNEAPVTGQLALPGWFVRIAPKPGAFFSRPRQRPPGTRRRPARQLPVAVLHRAVRHLVLLRVRIFDVADRALIRWTRRDAFVALAADAFGPRDRGARANIVLPLGTALRKVVGPQERRARAIRAPHHGDRVGGQLERRIQVGNRLVVPRLDLAEIDVGQYRTRELDRTGSDSFQVHDGNDATDDRGKLHQAGSLQVFGLEWHVGRAEVDGLGLDLADAATDPIDW